jgi:hypothetical protein
MSANILGDFNVLSKEEEMDSSVNYVMGDIGGTSCNVDVAICGRVKIAGAIESDRGRCLGWSGVLNNVSKSIDSI